MLKGRMAEIEKEKSLSRNEPAKNLTEHRERLRKAKENGTDTQGDRQ